MPDLETMLRKQRERVRARLCTGKPQLPPSPMSVGEWWDTCWGADKSLARLERNPDCPAQILAAARAKRDLVLAHYENALREAS